MGSNRKEREAGRGSVTARTLFIITLPLAIGILFGYFLGNASISRVEGVPEVDGSRPSTAQVTEELEVAGDIIIDGSSTVFPIMEAAAEAFMDRFPSVNILVGISGTGGGFKRFVRGEIDVNDASRPIMKVEAEEAMRNGVEWIEIPIAIDGLTIAVNKGNTWVDCLSLSELKKVWEPRSEVRSWSDIRAGWPDNPIILYGPGPDSGTFDYFTERVIGERGASRIDYIASEDDNVLVAGIEGELYALGYFGYAYYFESRERIRAVAVKDDLGGKSVCIEPTEDNIRTYEYPLARPLFIYVNKDSWERKPQLREFVYFYLENGEEIVERVGYVPLPPHYYSKALALLRGGVYRGLFELTFLKDRDAGPR